MASGRQLKPNLYFKADDLHLAKCIISSWNQSLIENQKLNDIPLDRILAIPCYAFVLTDPGFYASVQVSQLFFLRQRVLLLYFFQQFWLLSISQFYDVAG
jgi:hypothetical protein